MSTRTARVGLSLLLGVFFWCGSMAAQSASPEGKDSAAGHPVVVTLKIADKQSGLVLEAKKSVPHGPNAFEILQGTVAVKYKTYPNLGVFVTGLCGIDAPEGKVWTFTVDSNWSDVGIGKLKLERDVVIEWTTR